MTMQPGWADAYAAAVKTGSQLETEKVTGQRPVTRWRVNTEKWKESCSRGGLKGGKAKKGTKHK